MKLEELKRINFYTDGEKVYLKSKDGKRLLVLTEPETFKTNEDSIISFTSRGVDVAYAYIKGNEDYRKVEAGETFYNGSIKVIDVKNIEILEINVKNAKYDDKGYIINHKELKYDAQWVIKNIKELMW